jgi:hypothetical protein
MSSALVPTSFMSQPDYDPPHHDQVQQQHYIAPPDNHNTKDVLLGMQLGQAQAQKQALMNHLLH